MQKAQKNHSLLAFTTMKCLFSEKVNHILLLLNAGHSAYQIHSSTDVSIRKISNLCREHCPFLQKSTEGCLKKLSNYYLCQATCLVHSDAMQNATQVAKHLRTVNSISLSTQTVCCGLKKQGIKAVKKPKKPYLRPHHKRMRMKFAKKYKD